MVKKATWPRTVKRELAGIVKNATYTLPTRAPSFANVGSAESVGMMLLRVGIEVFGAPIRVMSVVRLGMLK